MSTLKQRYGSWALVTGASSGVGEAVATELARAGIHIVAVARNQARLDRLAESLERDFQVQVKTISADLSQRADTLLVLEKVADLEIGILVPAAAIEYNGYFIEQSQDEHSALAELDMMSPMLLAHHLGQKMVRRGRGAILFISSMAGLVAQPLFAHYSAAKAYIVFLAEALHYELDDKGVDVSVLSPGPTATPMLEGTGVDFEAMGMKVMTASDVAQAGLEGLGPKLHIVPGYRNRAMLFAMTRLLPRSVAGRLSYALIRKARKKPKDKRMSRDN